jgi:hypothetical protein
MLGAIIGANLFLGDKIAERYRVTVVFAAIKSPNAIE